MTDRCLTVRVVLVKVQFYCSLGGQRSARKPDGYLLPRVSLAQPVISGPCDSEAWRVIASSLLFLSAFLGQGEFAVATSVF